MKLIKMIAIDLDGTLFSGERIISEKNKAAITAAKNQGVKVVLCTGRPLRSITSFIKELGLDDDDDYSITFNGGLIQRNGTGEVLNQMTVSPNEIQKVYEVTSQLDLPLDVISDGTVYHITPTPESRASLYYQVNPKLTFENMNVTEINPNLLYNKMIIAADAKFLDQQLSKFPAELEGIVTMFKSRPMLLEVMALGVDKAKGIQMLEEELGITKDEVMAIGDEANDLPMIRYAGLGVAMGNGTDEVKAAADVITDANYNDGVAKAIEKYVLNQA